MVEDQKRVQRKIILPFNYKGMYELKGSRGTVYTGPCPVDCDTNRYRDFIEAIGHDGKVLIDGEPVKVYGLETYATPKPLRKGDPIGLWIK